MNTPKQDLVRDAVLEQEIDRVTEKHAYHADRLDRGVGDDEDRAVANLYARIMKTLEGLRR